ncbi:hypothetical protein V1511DRAFT_373855 [Dipodascopsis uninucleata]
MAETLGRSGVGGHSRSLSSSLLHTPTTISYTVLNYALSMVNSKLQSREIDELENNHNGFDNGGADNEFLHFNANRSKSLEQDSNNNNCSESCYCRQIMINTASDFCKNEFPNTVGGIGNGWRDTECSHVNSSAGEINYKYTKLGYRMIGEVLSEMQVQGNTSGTQNSSSVLSPLSLTHYLKGYRTPPENLSSVSTVVGTNGNAIGGNRNSSAGSSVERTGRNLEGGNSFARQMFMHSLAYLLRALPEDVSYIESVDIGRALPDCILDGEYKRRNLDTSGYSNNTANSLMSTHSGINSSESCVSLHNHNQHHCSRDQHQQHFMADRSVVQDIVVYFIRLIAIILRILVPHVVTFMRKTITMERQYKFSQRALGAWVIFLDWLSQSSIGVAIMALSLQLIGAVGKGIAEGLAAVSKDEYN